MEVVVTGIGLVSALGMLETSWRRLKAGESAITVRQPFPELSPRPLALVGAIPSYLTPLIEKAVGEAVVDAGLVTPLPEFSVVLGSSRSYQGEWEQLRNNPNLDSWLDTLPHMGAIVAARQIGATGAILAPMAACATGIWAIAQAALLIQTGQSQQVLAGAVEAPITPLTLAGFDRMGASAKTGCYPFDKAREGLVLGEGGAILVLESLASAQQRQARIYGKISGFGFSADGYHVSAPEVGSKSAIAAIQQCLDRSQLHPSDIDYIHAHGTSTPLNDRNEAQLIQSLFPQVPVSSTKGATGHTLGASGALGVAFSLMALQEQVLPPCVGLQETEFNLNLVKKADSHPLKHILCFSFGFGGQNAVLALTEGWK
ncbi:beta-ketoacyl-ACP synthase [Desertifilum tharense]|nr:beta-ketoacyl-ACP synthase [Desertifilum tharense]MDA0209279.1 beta-ketoacyl-ACP synthase [Cyanobacteria bacterium FC1]